jgi:hypothetical protein
MLCVVMASPTLIAFERATVGRTCDIQRRGNDWAFVFGAAGDGSLLVTASLWRVVEGGRIAVTSEDDGHPFGLPAPMDAQEKSRGVFAGRLVRSVGVDAWTGDVTIQFEGDARLDVISSSAGYENWQAYFREADQDVILVGGGGGALSCASAPAGANPRMLVGGPLAEI